MSSSTGGAPPHSGMVRVQVHTLRPSVLGFGKSVWRFATGAVDADFVRRLRRTQAGQTPEPGKEPVGGAPLGITPFTFAPLALKATKASYVFDAQGVRMEGHPSPPLVITWTELERVGLQLLDSGSFGMKILQLVLWPADEQAFALAHPEGAKVWNPAIRALTLPICKGTEIPPNSVDGALAGAAYAGSLFDGRVEHIDAAV